MIVNHKNWKKIKDFNLYYIGRINDCIDYISKRKMIRLREDEYEIISSVVEHETYIEVNLTDGKKLNLAIIPANLFESELKNV